MLEYQNKALASLLRTQKQKVAELTAKLDRSATERASLESNLATLSNKLLSVSQSVNTLDFWRTCKTNYMPYALTSSLFLFVVSD